MLGLPVLLGLLAAVAGMLPKLESTCETLANRIHITKEEFNKAKELMRTCEEDIEMMKCEGSCVSSTMPSAMERWVGAPWPVCVRCLCQVGVHEGLQVLPRDWLQREGGHAQEVLRPGRPAAAGGALTDAGVTCARVPSATCHVYITIITCLPAL